MKKMILAAALVAFVSGSANALTIKSGEVLTRNADGSMSVVKASETKSAKLALERDGYYIGGGSLFLAVGDHVVEVDIKDLAGKSKDDQQEVVKEAAVEQITEAQVKDITATAFEVDSAAHDAALEAAGIAVAKTVDEVNAALADAEAGIEIAIDESNEAVKAAIEEYNEKSGAIYIPEEDVGGGEHKHIN